MNITDDNREIDYNKEFLSEFNDGEKFIVKEILDSNKRIPQVYIMEQTLNENDDCTMDNIAVFLDDILPFYNKEIPYERVLRLSEYMIKDILQNKGLVKTYGTMNYFKSWNEVRIRLISDIIIDIRDR